MPKRYQQLLDKAKQHGEDSEPDHEVGDLQDIIRTCFEVMTEEQIQKVLDTHKE